MIKTATSEWVTAYLVLANYGTECAPRGMKIKETFQYTFEIDMRYPVLALPGRKVNYPFMMAEAAWILAGRNDAAYPSRFLPAYANYSDDGQKMAGAYGPRISSQMDYVVNKLCDDRDTRQATLTIWDRNPTPTKDYPCTVAMSFMIRDDKLNCHVYMRSNDLWKGTTYDVFTFSAVASAVLSRYNVERSAVEKRATLGTLYLTAASLHLYETNWGFIVPDERKWPKAHTAPMWFLDASHTEVLTAELEEMALTKPGDNRRWWE